MLNIKKRFLLITSVSVTLILFTFILGITHKSEKRIKNQWALMNTGQEINGESGKSGIDINAIEAWGITLGNEAVVVGVLDTGIDISNPKISDSIFINEDEIEGNGIDDDGNGFIDDVNGWNFYTDNNILYDSYLSDYHGTFIASLIAGAHDSDEVWGIAPKVKILPLKFMYGSSGDIDDAIEAIDYAYSMGVRIINCSWDTTEYSSELYEKIKEYSDILFVCSSGNTRINIDNTPVYPASFDLENVICVGAVNNEGELYKFSGYGTEKLVLAPGEAILGMLPEGDYLYSDGTSFATAYVTGIASLMKSIYLDITVEEVAEILSSNNENIIDSAACLNKAMELIK